MDLAANPAGTGSSPNFGLEFLPGGVRQPGVSLSRPSQCALAASAGYAAIRQKFAGSLESSTAVASRDNRSWSDNRDVGLATSRALSPVFLAFFPLFTLALAELLAHWHQQNAALQRAIARPLLLWLALFLANYGLWTTLTTASTAAKLRQGRYPQNLLEQFYRNSHQASQAVRQTLQRPDAANLIIIAAFHQALPFRHYWYAAGNDPARIIDHHRQPRQVQALLRRNDYRDILLLASGKSEARSLLAQFPECDQIRLRQIAGAKMYRLFAIAKSNQR